MKYYHHDRLLQRVDDNVELEIVRRELGTTISDTTTVSFVIMAVSIILPLAIITVLQ